jgi:parvulin-like peptidyl-prolyl isomerase
MRCQALLATWVMVCCASSWAQGAGAGMGAGIGAGAAAVADDTVVLRSGDFTLSKADYEKLLLGFERSAGAPTTGATAQSAQSGQEVARLLALVSEAQRRKIDQTPQMQALMRVRGYVLLSNALLKSLTDEVKLDEAGTRALWASEKNNYLDVQARQILIRFQGVATEGTDTAGTQRTAAQAKTLADALFQKLKAGADFEALAKSSSDDQRTRNQGGRLPVFTRGATQAEFENVAFTAPVGSVNEPFKTKYGWHVVVVDERRPFAFERVRPTLEFMRAKQKLEAIASTGVQLNDSYFKP